jgi:hypothetical protein
MCRHMWTSTRKARAKDSKSNPADQQRGQDQLIESLAETGLHHVQRRCLDLRYAYQPKWRKQRDGVHDHPTGAAYRR